MVRVLATGTFDILHPGHLLYLREAKKLGDELWVIVARNSMVNHKSKPILPENQRLAMVSALRVVDHAMLGDEQDMFKPLEEIHPDIVVLGHDQHFNAEELEEKMVSRGIYAKVVRISSYQACSNCSTGSIIRSILDRSKRS
ncbi:MAG TPA: adenylyltransferase/cytidyltransferase family protein [Candidatus Nanoarchaeia archaeon]|nr:adenylyltransferase/cytidyltransferase family protein [Candidatus Nanoarchaeia archaeon]